MVAYMEDLKVLQRIADLKGKTIKLVLTDVLRWYLVTNDNEILGLEVGFADDEAESEDYLSIVTLSKVRIVNIFEKKSSMDPVKRALAMNGVLDYDALKKAENERIEREKAERAERAEKQEYETYLRLKAKYEQQEEK